MERRLRQLILACTALLALAGCGDSGAELDAALLRLELRYPVSGQPDLRITGQDASAPRGATIVCRTTGDERVPLGRADANEDGSFEIALDDAAYPMNELSGDFMDLNRTLECRADGGPWVSPLRPPLVAIG
jgi:hypothetical protein